VNKLKPFQLFFFSSELNITTESSNEQMEPPFKWNVEATVSLLSFLKGRKRELKELVDKRGGSRINKAMLWREASSTVSDDEKKYSPNRCEIKWKNIKQECKVNLFFLLIKNF